MARLLQYLSTGSPRRRCAAMVAAALLVGSCVASPPIEPRVTRNLAPRIRPLPPNDTPVIEVNREGFAGQVELRADLFDGNDEPELRYLFLSDERGDPRESGAPLQATKDDAYYFGEVSLAVLPCTGDVDIPGTEVITLYVSDRGFYSISPDPTEIVEAEGSILVAYSWTLKYEAGICDAEL